MQIEIFDVPFLRRRLSFFLVNIQLKLVDVIGYKRYNPRGRLSDLSLFVLRGYG